VYNINIENNLKNMALQGNYNFKDISISEAYIKIVKVTYYNDEIDEHIEKTPAVYNEDGSVKTEAVMETVTKSFNNGNYIANVYKDKDSRDSNLRNNFQTISGNFDFKVNSTAKNPVVQAYQAIKTEEAYKDYTDV